MQTTYGLELILVRLVTIVSLLPHASSVSS